MLKQLIAGIKSLIGARGATGEEGRARSRVLCRYSVSCWVSAGQNPFRARVVDISRTGMRLEGVGNLSKGDQLQVHFIYEPGDASIPGGVGPVNVEVMWCRKRAHDGARLAGVRYLDGENLANSWVQYVLDEVGLADERAGGQKRQHIRLTTNLRAEVRDQESGQHLFDGKVLNLSVGGILVEATQEPRDRGEVLILIAPYNNFPILSLPGRILNVRDDDEGTYHASLQFTKVNAKDAKKLKRYVFSLLKGRTI